VNLLLTHSVDAKSYRMPRYRFYVLPSPKLSAKLPWNAAQICTSSSHYLQTTSDPGTSGQDLDLPKDDDDYWTCHNCTLHKTVITELPHNSKSKRGYSMVLVNPWLWWSAPFSLARAEFSLERGYQKWCTPRLFPALTAARQGRH
jgi:hypothetical protein